MTAIDELKFIADENVGKLARLLRMLGFDTLFFKDGSDSRLVDLAVTGQRIILTRDTHIQERKLILRHQARLILIRSDQTFNQYKQIEGELDIKAHWRPFSLCLECNQLLLPVSRHEVCQRVPPYVFQTQNEYLACPVCRRVYWKGSHWLAMNKNLLTF